ncbi:SDR family oxidoreductase [Pseudonocardia sp.]|uniref:SDR family oxidoreductase n=1 Tax=Pseudonocardia sp. TaxID=60912 RepID=UPI003D0D0554
MDVNSTFAGPRRRLVVTGAASGIGAALAARLVAAGHEVIGVDRDTDGVPPGVAALRCDLTDAAATAAAIGTVTAAGDVDGLAAVAGVPGTAPAHTVYAVNVLGLRRSAEALAPSIRPGGAIVLLSSMAGYRGTATDAQAAHLLGLDDDALAAGLAALGLDGPDAYQLSKQLVHHYTMRLAARLHPAGVRVLSVSPGPVETPILADFRATMPSLDVAGELVGRHARPAEIAAIVDFALSPDASWLDGTDVRADGGLTALRAAAAPLPAL